MDNFFKIIALLAALALGFAASGCQTFTTQDAIDSVLSGSFNKDKLVNDFVTKLKGDVGLTPAQETEVQPVAEDYVEGVEQVGRQQAAGERTLSSALEELKALQQQADRTLQTILTDQQVESYQAIRGDLFANAVNALGIPGLGG